MELKLDTGTGVVPGIQEGVFQGCQDRTQICGFACCDFKTLGNHIFALPGELEEAEAKGLTFGHVEITHLPEGSDVNCVRVCNTGEFKSIDCMIHPLWPANESATLFSISDRRKCPVPVKLVVKHAIQVGKLLRDWDSKHPGSLKAAVEVGRKLNGHQAFPYEINEDGTTRDLTMGEMAKICPPNTLPDDYQIKWPNAENLTGYGPLTTPEG